MSAFWDFGNRRQNIEKPWRADGSETSNTGWTAKVEFTRLNVLLFSCFASFCSLIISMTIWCIYIWARGDKHPGMLLLQGFSHPSLEAIKFADWVRINKLLLRFNHYTTESLKNLSDVYPHSKDNFNLIMITSKGRGL